MRTVNFPRTRRGRVVAASLLGLALTSGVAVAADAATGTVHTASASLSVRSGPGTGYAKVGTLRKGAKVDIVCQTYGGRVDGTYGSSRVWNKIGAGRWISDAYTYTGSDGFVAPRCGSGDGPSDPAPTGSYPKVWDRVAQCESTGRWHVNTGNGYYGGLQFSASTWRAFGGGKYAAYAHQATKLEQVRIAQKVLRAQGPGAWPNCSRVAGLTRANGL
jgi:uncharacterized protein YraI